MKSKKILCKSRYSRMRSAIISLGLIISFLMPLFCGCRMPTDSNQDTPALSDFTANEIFFFSDEDANVTFTVSADSRKTVIQLCQGSGDALGAMHDDGKNGDEAAGDGTYTYVLTVNSPAGKAEYYAQSGKIRSNSETLEFFDKPTEEQIETVQEIEAGILNIGAQYEDENGYTPEENVQAALSEAAEYAKTFLDAGQIRECETTDCSVIYTLDSGGIMVFSPDIEDTNSGGGKNNIDPSVTIHTIQTTVYGEALNENIMVSLPGGTVNAADLLPTAADLLDDRLDNCNYDLSGSLQNTPISLPGTVVSIAPNQIVLWDGHGAWGGETCHSLLLTGSEFNHAACDYSPFNPDFDMWYWGCWLTGLIVNVNGKESISSEFIDRWCHDMSNSYIYLSACNSGRDSVLAQSFLNKGAAAVIGYTRSVLGVYASLVGYKSTVLLSQINPDTQNYYTLGEALAKAKSIYGVNDAYYYSSNGGFGAEPALFGDAAARNYRIRNTHSGDLPVPTPEPALPVPGSQIKLNFETEPVTDGWTWEDKDRDGKNWCWQHSGEPDSMPEGMGCMVSVSYDSDLIYFPDNWLVSPVIPGGGEVSFILVIDDPRYIHQALGVYVSTDGGYSWNNELCCFDSNESGKRVNIDLSQFKNQDIKLAFRHYDVIDKNYVGQVCGVIIDDVVVTVGGEAPEPTSNPNINVPEGYDPNGYLKLRAFLETEDENGVKNGDKLWTGEFCEEEHIYNPDDPETWEVPMDDEYNGVFWYVDDDGIKKVSDIYLHCYYDDVLVGELDLSEMGNINQVSAWGIDGITALNTDGCDIKCLYFREGALRNIDWRCEEEDINIQLKSSGEGFVGVDYDNDIDEENWDLENAHWCAYARPVQGKQFLGWYDNNGNCVGTELRYEFTVIPAPAEELHWAPSPTGIHLNLEARFAAGSEPTPAPVASVTFHDPVFEAAFRKKYNITGTITMDMILSYEELDLSGCGLVDITDAAMFKNLIKLDIGGNRIDNDNSALLAANAISELTKLTDLCLAGNWLIDSFDVFTNALPEMPNLKKIDLTYCHICELPDLSLFTNLEHLILDNNGIDDITPLSKLRSLTALDIGMQRWGDSPTLASACLTDITPISNMKNLVWLDLGDNDLLDITPLSALTNLTYLNINYNGSYDPWEHTWSDQIEDISPLSGLTKLTELYIDGCGGEDWVPLISDISPLSGLINLTKLHLGWNKISDISPLSGLTKLTELWLENNDLTASTDVSPLFDLTLLETLSIKSGNELTQSQIDAIQSHLPNCTIN